MLIGIQSSTGARSGKDTVANIIQESLGINRYAFAKPIKESINELFGWDERHEDGALKEIVLPTFLPSSEQWREVVGNFYRKCTSLDSISKVCCAGSDIHKVFDGWCYDNKRVVKYLPRNGIVGGGLESPKLLHISPREVYQLFGTEMMRECISDSFWTDIAPTENVIITDVRFKNETEWLFSNGGVLIDVKRPDNNVTVASHASEAGTGVGADYEIVNDGTLEQLDQEVAELVDILERHFEEGA